MKILQIASGDFFSTYGGGQVYVKNIVEEMIRQGLDVAVLSFVGNDIGIVEQDYKGISLWEIGTQAEVADIESLVRNISPNVIHAHSQKALFSTLGKRLHIPVVVTAHHGGICCPAGTLMNAEDCICNTTLSHEHCLKCCLANIRTGRSWYPMMKLLSKKGYQRLGKSLEKFPFIPFVSPIGGVALSIENKQKEWQTICDKVTMIIAPSNAIADAMCRNGLSRDKVMVIPHGIPKGPPPILTGKLNDKINFFYLGRIGRVKGINVLLDAFTNISVKNRALLHIVGEGGDSRGGMRYMRAIHKKYSSPNIIWHGKIPPEEVFDTIKSFDVMVHPAIYMEIFGLSIAEALAMNKPVLATRCGGAEMQIVDNVNGWLVEPNNTQSLQSKIEEIISQGLNIDTTTLSNRVKSIYEHVLELLLIYKKCVINTTPCLND